MNRLACLSLLVLMPALCACQQGGNRAAEGERVREGPGPAFAAIAPEDHLRFTGTEPFWGGEARGDRLTYTTPENPEGTHIAISRFAGNNGLSLSGRLGGQSFDMAITQAPCSDGMSEYTYPFTVSLRIGGEERSGCAWTDRQPVKAPETP